MSMMPRLQEVFRIIEADFTTRQRSSVDYGQVAAARASKSSVDDVEQLRDLADASEDVLGGTDDFIIGIENLVHSGALKSSRTERNLEAIKQNWKKLQDLLVSAAQDISVARGMR